MVYSGRPRYGWEMKDGVLLPCAEEQAVIEKIRVLRAEGISVLEIRRRLNATQAPHRASTGWHAKHLYRIMDHYQIT